MSERTIDVIRALIGPIYVPWVGIAICLGMLSLSLPLYLTDVGLGYGPLSTILAAAGIGSALGGLPTGSLLARVGIRPALVGSVLTMAATSALMASSADVVVLFVLQFVSGLGAVAVRLGGQSWITATVAARQRGRALSAMGGIRRFGAFVGPVLAGVLVEWVGHRWTFVVAGALAAVGAIPLLAAARRPDDTTPVGGSPVGASLLQVLRRHRRLLLLAAAGPLVIMTVRRGRAVVLPLIGDDLGISPTALGLLVGVSTGADLLLFPVSGLLMDRYGRLAAIVPAFTLMGAGLVALGLADRAAAVVVAGAVIGVGNGLSSGTMMTLASDLAPRDGIGPFIAGFATIVDWGVVFGPLLVGWVAALVGLGPSAAVLGVLMFIGVAVIVMTVGETGEPRISTPMPRQPAEPE